MKAASQCQFTSCRRASIRVYAPIDRTRRSEFTTLIVAPMSDRKNTQHAVAAWGRAFGTDSRARLLIKNRYPGYDYVPDDRRIVYVSSYELTRGIASGTRARMCSWPLAMRVFASRPLRQWPPAYPSSRSTQKVSTTCARMPLGWYSRFAPPAKSPMHGMAIRG